LHKGRDTAGFAGSQTGVSVPSGKPQSQSAATHILISFILFWKKFYVQMNKGANVLLTATAELCDVAG